MTEIPGTKAGADGGTKAARHWLKIKGRARQLAGGSDLLLLPAQHRRPLLKTTEWMEKLGSCLCWAPGACHKSHPSPDDGAGMQGWEGACWATEQVPAAVCDATEHQSTLSFSGDVIKCMRQTLAGLHPHYTADRLRLEDVLRALFSLCLLAHQRGN